MFTSRILLSLLFGLALQAQTMRSAKIEATLTQQLNSPEGETTSGMVDAYDTAAKGYRAEIDRVYNILLAGLPINPRRALLQTQKTWEAYLESYREAVSYIYDAPGTIHKIEGMSALKTFLEHRLIELCSFFLRDGPDEFSEEVPGKEYWCGDSHVKLKGKDPLRSKQ
jgi:hypothetical protein